MKILIIGSKGFIGRHCVNYFSKFYTVYQCDVGVDYSTSNYYQIDATNADYNELFQLNKFDFCINCSGAASVSDSIIRPHRDFTLNTVNVFKQLDAIRQFNTNCKYINISSAAVYGNPIELPITEEHKLKPISPYGLHKKMAEDICREFHSIYNLNTCSLRVFSAYGLGLQKQLFWDLYQKTKKSSKVELFGTGLESRDFINVLDLMNAIYTVIKNSDFKNNIINVANGEELTIKFVVDTFYDLLEENINYDFNGEIRHGDPVNWVADISKLKSLGYKQEVSLKSGLTAYIKWLRENE
jgi:UDP-glucose 4-epimerase